MPAKKKSVKVRDLKPSKDAKGGGRNHQYGATKARNLRNKRGNN